jgi:hypothetical protein
LWPAVAVQQPRLRIEELERALGLSADATPDESDAEPRTFDGITLPAMPLRLELNEAFVERPRTVDPRPSSRTLSDVRRRRRRRRRRRAVSRARLALRLGALRLPPRLCVASEWKVR